MQEIIEKLLVLQDRDRKIHHVQAELAHIIPERDGLKANAISTQTQLDTAKNRVKQVEAERKRLELEIESKKAQILKYANQQLETRKNEEYRALAHEIDLAKETIFKIEDQEINLMEQAEVAQKGVVKATADAAAAKKLVDEKIVHLDQREANLRKELAELQSGRAQMISGIDEPTAYKYERLLKHKGDNVVVGVEHSVCGGCHMRLPAQIMASCRGQAELITCTNCGRILYFTRDMVVTATE
jgi:predicted  nucleic acid-binding Zn-ribbon protein